MTKEHFAAFAIVLVAASYGALAQSNPSSGGSAMSEFDCVIEPKMMIKLASPESGVIHSVIADRDKTVEQGEVVAELESYLQRIALELARLKASSVADLDSQVARLDFRNLEAERQTAL